MAATAPVSEKKGGKKKKKGKTVNLNEFLSDSSFIPPPSRSSDWADDSVDFSGNVDLAEEYGGPAKPVIDLSKLPSAPRSSRGVDIDLSRLPSQPPYTAFLGNLPFDVDENDIQNLFRGLQVDNIRFPQEMGRMKGFGYAEFNDVDQLKSALALNNEKIRTRQVRIDIADQAGRDQRDGGGGMGREGKYERDDKTTGDWRSGGGDFSTTGYNDRGGGFRGGDVRGGDFAGRDSEYRKPHVSSQADADDMWRHDDPQPPVDYNRDNRGGGRFGGRDDGPWGGRRGYRVDRGGDRGGGGFRDDKGGGFRDDREGGGSRYDRGSGGFRDDRAGSGFNEDRSGGGGWNSSRGGGRYNDGGPRDFQRDNDESSSEAPKERPKLNLKPRSTERKQEVSAGSSSSSIFGAARPVDTAAKERQIEEKLSHKNDMGRGRRDDRGHGDRDGSHDRVPYGSPGRDNYRSPPRDDLRRDDRKDNYRDAREEFKTDNNKENIEEADDWRDESLRLDKPRIMRPGLVSEANMSRERTTSEGSDKGRDEMTVLKKSGDNHRRGEMRGGRGRGKHSKDRTNDGPVALPKYEEPAKPVFIQNSKFAALGVEGGDSDPDEGYAEEA